jgi:hypothetical protein
LIPYAVEIVTAITITLIGVILTVYLSILKKNGWIGKTSNYRCPNPQCKSLFQKPIRVKDFSTQKEVSFACPECGYNLGSINGEVNLQEITLESEPEIKIKDVMPIDNKIIVANNGTEEPKIVKTSTALANSKGNLPEADNSFSLKDKFTELKKDRPVGCKNYFGYLGTLPDGAKVPEMTPDVCYSCSKLVDCYRKSNE